LRRNLNFSDFLSLLKKIIFREIAANFQQYYKNIILKFARKFNKIFSPSRKLKIQMFEHTYTHTLCRKIQHRRVWARQIV